MRFRKLRPGQPTGQNTGIVRTIVANSLRVSSVGCKRRTRSSNYDHQSSDLSAESLRSNRTQAPGVDPAMVRFLALQTNLSDHAASAALNQERLGITAL